MPDTLMQRLMRATKQELAHTLAALCEEVGAAESSILLPADDTDLVFFASTNAALMEAGPPRVPMATSFSGIAYCTGQTIAVADAASQAPHYKAVDELVGQTTREYAAIPLAERTVLGVLTLVNRVATASGEARPFGMVELRRAEAVARELAHAIAQLPGLTGISAREGEGAQSLGSELMSELALLDDAERRIVQALAGALIQNRAG